MANRSLRKIGEVAELLGTTPRTLRFYEEEGLVSACRSPGGTRLYDEEAITRFRAIIHLAQLGVPLNVIQQLATARSLSSTGAESSCRVGELIQPLLEKLAQQKQSLIRLEGELSAAAKAIRYCSDCPNPPTRAGCPGCPINALTTGSEMLNLVWELNPCSE